MNFDVLSKDYALARKEYPWPVVGFCRSLIPDQDPLVLDLGCGTGISSRQLADTGTQVVGCDISNPMLTCALRRPRRNIRYILCNTECLPFPEKSFNAVTAFASFHHCGNEKTIAEIRRVLKRNGVFFAIHKSDFGRPILEEILGRNFPSLKQAYRPVELLRQERFNTDMVEFQGHEYYSLDEFLAYVQSISYWNLISAEEKIGIIEKLQAHFAERAQLERLEHKFEVRIVVAFP